MPTLIRCPFHHRVTAVACKRSRSFCQKCRWQVTPIHVYNLDPMKSELADYAAVHAECGNLSENKLTCNSSGNTWPQLSQHAEPLWTDPGLKRLKSEISVCDLISTLKKKAQSGNELSNISPKSLDVEKKPENIHTHHTPTGVSVNIPALMSWVLPHPHVFIGVSK